MPPRSGTGAIGLGASLVRPAVGKPWASLSLYESPELVRRLAKEATGRGPNAAKAREISAHFSQGREYFGSAAGAGALVRPLILYYGALALARGAVLFLDPEKSKIEAAHGLDAPGWRDLLAQPDELAGSNVLIGSGGTFVGLASVTGNAERIRVQAERSPGVADATSPGSTLAPETVLTIQEILGQIPDVAALYERTFSEHSRRLRSEVIYTGRPESRGIGEEIPPDKKIRQHSWLGVVRTPPPLGLPPEGWAEDLLEAGSHGTLGSAVHEGFLYFARFPQEAPTGRIHDLYCDAGSRDEPHLLMPLAAAASGEEYLKLPTDRGVVLSTLLALHLIAYATGTLVRYHPGYWATITARSKGDAIGPVLSAAVSAVEERYPALILGAIGG